MTGPANEAVSRPEALKLIWRHTHRDYKGGKGGDRSILMFVPGKGTSLVPLTAMTDEQIDKLLPYALKKESERRAKAGAA